jgi:hypothetical protein
VEVVCDEHGIGGGGEYCGNDAQFDRIGVFYHEAPGGEYASPRGAHKPRAWRDKRFNPKSPLGELFRPGSLVNQNAGAGNIWAKGRYTRAEKGF